LPAVLEWSDFDDRHGKNCIFLQSTLSVRLNMLEPNNGQPPIVLNPEAAQGFTAERVLRTRPKTYRAIVQLLADPHASVNQIAKLHRVSTHSVRAIRAREAKAIAERKQRLISIFGNVAELSAERMEQLVGKAKLRDAGISAGIATDKLLALTGEVPSTNIAIINMATPEERKLLNECHRRLTAISSGESKDVKADVTWLAAYSKWEKSRSPTRYNTIAGQWVDEAGKPLTEQPT
jgi:hypothetical protein